MLGIAEKLDKLVGEYCELCKTTATKNMAELCDEVFGLAKGDKSQNGNALTGDQTLAEMTDWEEMETLYQGGLYRVQA